MELQEIVKAMASTDEQTVKTATRNLRAITRHRNHNLQVIASLFANGHSETARRYAADTGTDIGSNPAIDRILCKLGNETERAEATRRLRQRQERLENSYAWQAIMRVRGTRPNESA